MISLETCFCAVRVFDRIAFLEFAFERFEHYGVDLPTLIATDTARYLRLLDANVRDNRNFFVVLPEITKRRPLVVLSEYRSGQNEKNDAEFE